MIMLSDSSPFTEPVPVVHLDQQPWYIAPDQSAAREIASPRNSRAVRLSIAEIIIPPGVEVHRHYHEVVEEIYYIVSGEGVMWLNGATRKVHPGDAIVIVPGEMHTIRNMTQAELKMIVTCTPPWTPDCSVMDPTWTSVTPE